MVMFVYMFGVCMLHVCACLYSFVGGVSACYVLCTGAGSASSESTGGSSGREVPDTV